MDNMSENEGYYNKKKIAYLRTSKVNIKKNRRTFLLE
jgi:hypothetical protein